MKKIGLLLSLMFFIATLNQIQAQKAIKNGFSINAFIGLPSGSFGLEAMEDVDELKIKTTFGLELGNRWYFNATEKYGIGLMVNWIDFSIGMKSTNFNNQDYGIAALDLTFLEVGPIGTYALSEDMAIDGYYNLRPTVFSYAIADENEDSYASAGTGISHTLGAAFRYNALNVGLEYVLGNINVSNEEESGIYIPDNEKMKVNNLRIVLGVKF
jgi:hypothetical protein